MFPELVNPQFLRLWLYKYAPIETGLDSLIGNYQMDQKTKTIFLVCVCVCGGGGGGGGVI